MSGSSPRLRGTLSGRRSELSAWNRPAPNGSSPRLRGTQLPVGQHPRHGRFIPAFAGNAPRWRPAAAGCPVHPRVCGERPRNTSATLPTARFIPAFAGNARWSTPRRSAQSVHPRVCGERIRLELFGENYYGSSPRLRGTHGRQFPGCQRDRFIPAFAGNASLCLMVRLNAAVHPRVCGERNSARIALCSWRGSSPRLRGTPV